jgi:hypothetical protein
MKKVDLSLVEDINSRVDGGLRLLFGVLWEQMSFNTVELAAQFRLIFEPLLIAASNAFVTLYFPNHRH